MLDITKLKAVPIDESVSIIVGPNGSGKSVFLRNFACRFRRTKDLVIVCNTPHDRFIGVSGVTRISVGKASGSPKSVVKRAVADSLSESNAMFYRISAILEYCGYQGRFGFSVTPGPHYGASRDELLVRLKANISSDDVAVKSSQKKEFRWLNNDDIGTALAFLRRHNPDDIVWIDATDRVLEFSRSREFAAVLANESKLRALSVLGGVNVYLKRLNSDSYVEIDHASSGQLALISTLLFLITNAIENSFVIIDEPENSLHPNWQREYVDKVLAALTYQNATIILATHAPLVVTGALAGTSASLVNVFEVQDGKLQQLISGKKTGSAAGIEEVLWRAFNVVTPANHFVSEKIVDEMNRFESGELEKGDVLASIKELESESFDENQKKFFKAVKKLLNEVDLGSGAQKQND